MKFLIISDTHKNLNKVRNVLPHLKGVDAILHLGDHIADAMALEKELSLLDPNNVPYAGLPVVGVPGNCDGSTLKSDYRIYETTDGYRFLLVHGHQYHVNFGYDRLLYLADEHRCDAALFGHTHIPVYDQIDDIILLNPGSLTNPRDGTHGSYGIITTSSAGITGSIVYYDRSVFEGNNDKKTRGGFIKGMLNYSDRF